MLPCFVHIPDFCKCFASAYSAYSTAKQQSTQAYITINKLCMYIHVHIMPLSQVGMCIFACVNVFACLCMQCILHIYTFNAFCMCKRILHTCNKHCMYKQANAFTHTKNTHTKTCDNGMTCTCIYMQSLCTPALFVLLLSQVIRGHF